MIKYIKRQDSGWKYTDGYSGETSINLSQEILNYLCGDYIDNGEEFNVVFNIHRTNLLEALDFVQAMLPLYRTTSRSCDLIHTNHPKVLELKNNIDSFFGGRDIALYPITIYNRKDGRIYMKGLRQKGFSIRDYLVEGCTALNFSFIEGNCEIKILVGTLE